ncbi:MAG TPA: hypothetical protein PKE06_19490 [Flavilitoribacter sp.]|nr:hypothetical protein [Flavilitoribacter sp.]HMQ90903.1 hypothetical protein [Flavilitoribacter sp.]
MHRHLILFIFLLLASCRPSPAPDTGSQSDHTSNADPADHAPDTVVQFLLSACVSDFNLQNQTTPIQFSTANLGYMTSPAGEKVYLLCGQFRSSIEGKWSDWIPFTTIKTADYEQWLGEQALHYCRDSTVVWVSDNDLSPVLKARLDSLPGRSHIPGTE